jgi:hypothetical protein
VKAWAFVTDAEIAGVIGTNCVWIHGASVGEIVATSPLVKEIKERMPVKKSWFQLYCWRLQYGQTDYSGS